MLTLDLCIVLGCWVLGRISMNVDSVSSVSKLGEQILKINVWMPGVHEKNERATGGTKRETLKYSFLLSHYKELYCL